MLQNAKKQHKPSKQEIARQQVQAVQKVLYAHKRLDT